MSVFPDPLPAAGPDPLNGPPDAAINPSEGVGSFAPHHLPDTAMDGSPALRPGDPDPAPTSDGAPIFSTDPLGQD